MHLAGGAKVAATACATASLGPECIRRSWPSSSLRSLRQPTLRSLHVGKWKVWPAAPKLNLCSESHVKGLEQFFHHGPNWISAGLLITQPLQPKLWNLMESKWLTKYKPVDTLKVWVVHCTVHSLRSLRCIISILSICRYWISPWFKESPPGTAGELDLVRVVCQNWLNDVEFPSPWFSMLLFTFMNT